MASWGDFDLWREDELLRWHDALSPREEAEQQAKAEAYQREIAVRPVGTRIVKKKAA